MKTFLPLLSYVMVFISYRVVTSLRTSIPMVNCRLKNTESIRKSYLKMTTTDTPTHMKPSPSYDISAIKSTIRNGHPNNNIPESIIEKVGSNLHLQSNHPLNIIKKRIENYCQSYAQNNKYSSSFQIYDDLSPIVDTTNCFDYLRVEKDHVSRRPSDTYYISNELLLRTHTSAHQVQFITSGVPAFLCIGDVYRRDEIDASHYPVFHQMEGVRIFQDEDFPATVTSVVDKKKIIEEDLKNLLTGLAKHLFGDVEIRWREDYFPFTEPSFELDVFFNGDWMEVLGCGVIHDDVMANAKKSSQVGWAFGMGLERLAMVLFGIPDIRLFWSKDERFLSQFKDGDFNKKFVPYSKYPLCYKDVSFWLPQVTEGDVNSPKVVHVNDIYEVIRNIGGDLIEKVDLFDEFTNKKNGKQSQAYRVTYRSMDRSLTNEEVDVIQEKIRQALVDQLSVTLR